MKNEQEIRDSLNVITATAKMVGDLVAQARAEYEATGRTWPTFLDFTLQDDWLALTGEIDGIMTPLDQLNELAASVSGAAS